jgi:ABC-type taurine transport system substrate-binding protein
VFSLVKDAAAFVNIRPANISNALRRGTASGGYHWEYA